MRRIVGSLLLFFTLGAGLGIGGCNTFQGALLYRDGTRALEEGRTDEAIRALEASARRAPGASEVQNHLGLAYLAAGRDADARRAFERALALDCDNRAAAHNLEALSGR